MSVEATTTNAAHLLRRAAWGGTPEEIAHVQSVGLEAAVDELFDASNAPIVGEPLRRPGFDAYDVQTLQSWFVSTAAASPTPAIERLGWFWSGHFATSIEKVEVTDLMHRQLVMLRRHGLGDFATLLKAVSRDTAMNIWLDLELSVVGNPNENFARELLELFSMGADNGYVQRDVVNVARAFTGYGTKFSPTFGRPTGTTLLRGSHDYGQKVIFGHRGAFDGDDVIELIAARSECHDFIARRIWHRYAGTTPTSRVIEQLASAFRARGRTIDLLRAMFTMPDFYRDDVKGGLISQPFEVLIRAVRGFSLPLPDLETVPAELADEVWESDQSVLPFWFVAEMSEILGQQLCFPPNVAGWPHNEAWLDSNRSAGRLLAGLQLGRYLVELNTPTAEAFRSLANQPRKLAEALFAAFGVTEWSEQTLAAIQVATSGSELDEALPAAFAVAFTSPEVTLA